MASRRRSAGAVDEVSITLELDCRRYLDDRAALVGYLRQEREKCLALLEGASAEEVLGRPDVVDGRARARSRTTPTNRPCRRVPAEPPDRPAS